MPNTLYYGDNLDVLRRHIKDESVDLEYLDPPFNSNATYNVLFAERNGTQAAAQIKAFGDTWKWDKSAALIYQETVENGGRIAQALVSFHGLLGNSNMMAYLAMMAPRLVELRRVLKPTGSIYLHCDPTASHYLKVLMDAVFGTGNFMNEVIWHRNSGGIGRTAFNKRHDTLLVYNKDRDRHFYSGKAVGDLREQNEGTFSGYFGIDSDGRKYREVRKAGRVYKYYMDEPKNPDDVWTVPQIPERDKTERLGYPTQKPEALLERIIKASCPEDGTVLDPFSGCGTAVVTAQRLGRQWIGIDITHLAINLIKVRLLDAFGDAAKYKVIGEPTTVEDAQDLAEHDPYQFQWWALGLIGARPVDQKKGADKGIDGRLYFHDDNSGKTKQIIISVKAGHTVNVTFVRDLRGVIERENVEIGVLITIQEPTQLMRTEVASSGFYESSWGKHPRLQILTISELLAGKRIDMPPAQGVNVTFEKAPRAKTTKGKQKQLEL